MPCQLALHVFWCVHILASKGIAANAVRFGLLSRKRAKCMQGHPGAVQGYHMSREEERTCRLCFGDEADGLLVQPCACRGTARWVHAACLESWRRTSEDAAYRCGQCNDNYRDALSLALLWARLQAERTSGRVTLITMTTLACELHDQGKLDEAEPLCREALDASRATLGDRHPDTLTSISNTASLLQDQGKLDEAELLCREDLDARRATLGDRHPATLISIGNTASLLKAQGKLDEAEPLCREYAAKTSTRAVRRSATATPTPSSPSATWRHC